MHGNLHEETLKSLQPRLSLPHPRTAPNLQPLFAWTPKTPKLSWVVIATAARPQSVPFSGLSTPSPSSHWAHYDGKWGLRWVYMVNLWGLMRGRIGMKWPDGGDLTRWTPEVRPPPRSSWLRGVRTGCILSHSGRFCVRSLLTIGDYGGVRCWG